MAEGEGKYGWVGNISKSEHWQALATDFMWELMAREVWQVTSMSVEGMPLL
jgi:hypothetical protein